MAQAATANNNTDELLSQLAASEIDRLLAEADGNPAPPAPEQKPDVAPPAPKTQTTTVTTESITEGSERAALLQAAGFDAPPQPAAASTPSPAPEPASTAPAEDERSALLEAAGFESPAAVQTDSSVNSPANPIAEKKAKPQRDPNHIPFYLKPLIWINAPLDEYPTVVRQIMGTVGLVTLFNALVVLTYVFFFRKR